MNKKCPKCRSISVKKDGKRNRYQSYRCKNCGHVFQNSRRIKTIQNIWLLEEYSTHKQTLRELHEKTGYSQSTIHRKITSILDSNYHSQKSIRLTLNLSKYHQSVLILDATFFGKKGSHTQWGILAAIDAISGDTLATKEILNESKQDYEALLRSMKENGYPPPLFAVIDGRNGIEACIQSFFNIPVQTCQYHKIATVERYLLKYPRIESYRELKRITRLMKDTDKQTFEWMLDEFRQKYQADFAKKELDTKTLKDRYVHPRLHYAFNSLKRDIKRLFIYQDFYLIIKKEINTTNRIECIFSHLKQKIRLHRGLIKKRRLSLALSLLWNN